MFFAGVGREGHRGEQGQRHVRTGSYIGGGRLNVRTERRSVRGDTAQTRGTSRGTGTTSRRMGGASRGTAGASRGMGWTSRGTGGRSRATGGMSRRTGDAWRGAAGASRGTRIVALAPRNDARRARGRALAVGGASVVCSHRIAPIASGISTETSACERRSEESVRSSKRMPAAVSGCTRDSDSIPTNG
jgi:hypothetical protein